MKILFVAVFNPNSTNYSQAQCFEELGHEVIRYEYREKLKEFKNPLGRDIDLMLTIEQEHPNLVLLSKCNGVSAKVLRSAKKLDITTCVWFMDTLVSWDLELEAKIKWTDFTACAWKGPYEKAKELSDNVYLIPEGFDQSVDYPVPEHQDIPVSFIGNPDGKRREWIEAVGGKIISNAYGRDHAKAVCRSKINLNFVRSGGSSDRVYKVLAAGGFLLTEDYPGLSEHFDKGKHLVIFDGLDDLIKKVDIYEEFATNERIRIAKSGWDHVQQYSRLGWAKKIIEAYDDTIS